MQLSNNYTAVRLLLSAMVLYSHSFALIGLDEPLLLGRTTGNLAVHGFFSVSGYLVAGSYLNSSSLSAFVYKRILRLGPALIVAYAASMWMHGQFGTFATNPVPYIANGSIWTLPWEGLMYVGVAAAGALGILRANVAASLFANGLFIYFLSSGTPTPANQAIAPLVLLFLGGAFIRLNADKLAVRRQGEVCFFVLVLLFAPIISDLFLSTLSNIPFLWGPDITISSVRSVLYLIAIPFVIIFICEHFYISMPIKNDYSYGIYLYAWPIQQVVVFYAERADFRLSPLTLFLFSGLLTLFAAILSWHLLEKPAMALKELRWTSRRSPTMLSIPIEMPAPISINASAKNI